MTQVEPRLRLRRLLLASITMDGHGHWLWDGRHTPQGKPIVAIDGKWYSVQQLIRLAFSVVPTPLDHHLVPTCPNKSCCSPGHLMMVPIKYGHDLVRRAVKRAWGTKRSVTLDDLEYAEQHPAKPYKPRGRRTSKSQDD